MAIKILILDDEREILNAFKRFLKLDDRFDVHVTSDPEKALTLLKKENIQVVISDIVMPNMNGIEFLEKAKEINGLIQVVMMTAYSTVERVIACLERGAADFIMKPFSEEEVASVLDDIVRRLEKWRRLVIQARGVAVAARERSRASGASPEDGGGQEEETGTHSPLDRVKAGLSNLRERHGDDLESLGVAIIEWIEGEEDQLVREKLAFELGEILQEQPSQELLERTLISRDAFLRNIVISISKGIGERIIPTLKKLMESEDKDVRKLVLDIASKMPLEKTEEILLAGLNDKDPNIRVTAAEYLGAQKSEKALKPIVEMVLEEKEPMVVATLLEVLAEMDHCPENRKIIERFKKDAGPILIHSFLKLLGAFGDQSDYAWLIDGLQNGKIHFSREVIDCLQSMMRRMDGLKLPETLEEMLEDEAENAINTLGAYQSLLTLYLSNAPKALGLAERLLERQDAPSFVAAAQLLAEYGEDIHRDRLKRLVEELDDEDMKATVCAALDSCCV